MKNIEMRVTAKLSEAKGIIWTIWLETRMFKPSICTKDKKTGVYNFAPGQTEWSGVDCLDTFTKAPGSQAEVELELTKWAKYYGLDPISLIPDLPEQENFFDAVRADVEISQEDKDYWLAMEAETMAAANKAS